MNAQVAARKEQEHDARGRALEAFDALFPHVLGNPYIPHWPTPQQARFLGAHLSHDPATTFEALFGGAAGGGKSDALLMGAAQYAWRHPEFAGVCIRRSYAELAQPEALMDRAMKWWLPCGVHWNGTEKLFTFPNGARVKMAYHGNPRDDLQFQGAAYQYAAWDELTHWPDARAYEWVSLSRLRRLEGSRVPLRALSASNPGGPGHSWVRDRFVGERDLVTGEWRSGPCPYYPSKVDDNPHIDRTAYHASLSKMHPTVRAQLRDGDWSAREPGDYFRAEWFGPLIDEEAIPNERLEVRWWDLAASERVDAARTAGVKMARLRSGVRVITHVVAFRKTPGARDAAILRQARLDGRRCVVGLEVEPGSGGIAQVENLAKRLKRHGFRVAWARPKVELTLLERKTMTRQPVSEKGKAGRADPVASCLERGFVRRGEGPKTADPWWGLETRTPLVEQSDGLRLVLGPWTQGYLDEVEGFPEDAALLDLADATTGAWAYLEAHPYGNRPLHLGDVEQPPGEQHDEHPEDRKTIKPRPTHGNFDDQPGRLWLPSVLTPDDRGHWTP